jgi:histone H3/H4
LKPTKLAMSETSDESEAERVAVSDEAAMVVSKMCELFVRYVSAQAGVFARRSARRSVRDDDIVTVFLTDHVFDFCIDIARFDPNDARLKRFPPVTASNVPPVVVAAVPEKSTRAAAAAAAKRSNSRRLCVARVVRQCLAAFRRRSRTFVAPAMLTLIRRAPSQGNNVTNDDRNNSNDQCQ